MSRRLHLVLSVFRSAFGNPTLRRVGLAYALFATAEFGIWLVLLVFAYQRGGPTAGMTMALVQLIPCIVLAPFIGSFADRRRPSRVLAYSYALQAGSFAAVAVGIGAGAPTFVIYLLAPVTALTMTPTRPAQAALLPAIVRTPDELTAANVMTGWTEGGASLVGPAIAGVVLALSGLTLAVAVMGALAAVSTILVIGVAGPLAAVRAEAASAPAAAPRPDDGHTRGGGEPGGGAEHDGTGATTGDLDTTGASTPDSITAGARSNLATILRNPQLRVLLTLHSFYFVLIGSLDLLCVILALTILHLGAGGAGYLNAALGAGALVAGFVTAFLVGRSHLSRTLILSLTVSVGALALIAVIPGVTVAFILIATVGLSGTVFDITGRTLLQRAAPPDAIAGAFSIFEATTDFGLAAGAVLVRVGIAVGGVRAALVAPAVLAVLLVAGLWRQLLKIDAGATIPHVEIQLLRSLPIFAALSPPSLEGVARELESQRVPAGTVVITEGERGEHYYAVADGTLTVTRSGIDVGTVGRGDGFGEIALVRDVPRQATVTADTDCLLFSLDKAPFVTTLSGHASAASAVSDVVDRHLTDGIRSRGFTDPAPDVDPG
ncbi:MAG: cyclic nucleotide-binding domain-containing protein [Acidimicrobiales bacterium]|jgi:MFS family permease